MKQVPLAHTLQFKINITFGVILIIALLLMASISVYVVGKALYNSEEARITHVAKAIALELEGQQNYVESLADSMALLVKLIPEREALAQQVEKLLINEAEKELVVGGGVWPEPYRLDPERERASLFWGSGENGLERYENYNASAVSAYYQEPLYQVSKLVTSGCFWSAAYEDPYTKELMQTCSQPVYINKALWGTASVDVSLAGINSLLDKYMAEVDGYAVMLDRNLRFLATPSKKALKRQLAQKLDSTITFHSHLKNHLETEPGFQLIADLIAKHRSQSDGAPTAQSSLSQVHFSKNMTAEDFAALEFYLKHRQKSRSSAIHGYMNKDPVSGEAAEVIIFYLPNVDNYLVLVVPERFIFQKMQTTGLQLLFVLLVSVLFCAVCISIYFHKVVIKPLNHMITSLRADKGQIPLLDVDNKSELGEFAKAYNKKQHELQLTTQKTRLAKERYKRILENAQEVILVIDQRLIIHEANPAAEKLLGAGAEKIKGSSLLKYIQESEQRDFVKWIEALLKGGSVPHHRDINLLNYHQDNVHVEASIGISSKDREDLLILFARDVSERRIAEQAMTELATTDSLTGLLNRASFNYQLEKALEAALGQSAQVALLFIDLDYFKEINDVRGHEVGDQLLVQVAQRLRLNRREADSVARLGGDEFAIILQVKNATEIIGRICTQIIESLNEPFNIGDNEDCRIGASIGISIYPDQADNPTELIRQADIAMYQAKEDGRNIWRFFAKEQFDAHQKRQKLVQDMKLAVEENQFTLDFQPIINSSGNVSLMEALIRWTHPENGAMPPMEFIPLAEKTGVIVEIGEWVIERVCQWICTWLDKGIKPPVISVNVSAVQLQRGGFCQVVYRLLQKYNLQGNQLLLEMTESLLIEGSCAYELQALRQMGLSIAIDDFGTGYSSLSYLQNHPVDFLKIDKAFVWAIDDNPDATLCPAIISLAKSLHTQVIAEGVEHIGQFDVLKGMGCDYMQGYWIGKPMPAEQVMQWLDSFKLPKE